MLASTSKEIRSKLRNTGLGLALLGGMAVLACTGCGQADQNKSTSETLASIRPQLVTSRGQMHFVRDAEAGLSLAAEKGLPCLMFFTADWCTYCHEMEETTFTDQTVAKMAEGFVCVLVDADHEKEICGQFSISAYPTIQFVSSQGRMLNRLVGRQSVPELVAGMQAAQKRFAWLTDSATQLR